MLGNPILNGIDFLEVLDSEAVPLGLTRQTTLVLHCLNPVATLPALTSIMITGGESITGVTAVWAAVASSLGGIEATPPPAPTFSAAAQAYFADLPDAANVIVIGTNEAGDFSTYTLRLVTSISQAEGDTFRVTEVLAGFDPHLAQVDFCFKVECPPNFDCAPQTDCPPPVMPPPPINYLAKDFGSFRQILLDRMNQLLPSWGATSEADMGIMLAELMAYVGDNLSYQQDAIATEAYIGTARSRISLRRHARLVDYFVHDGCNARAWMQVQVQGITGQQIFLDRTRTRFYTWAPGMPSNLNFGSGNEEAALLAGAQVFEPICDSILYPELNTMNFYTWGNMDCCLPTGGTEATLLGSYPNLQAGDVLIFQEAIGPQTGNPADADIRHRCTVRLTSVAWQNPGGTPLVDPLFQQNPDGSTTIITSSSQTGTAITEIQWSTDDALPFPVCISSTYLDENSDEQSVTNVSIALGNIVLADNGLTFASQPLGTLPAPTIYYPANANADRCTPTLPQPLAVRFDPAVPESPLAQAVPVSVVPMPAVGNPVAGPVVSLGTSGEITLPNAAGFTSLTLQVTNSGGWPSLFGVVVKAGTPGDIDVSVVYNPPGGAAGLGKQVTLESFTNLSLNSADANYAVTVINAASRLIQVAAGPSSTPSGFPAAPTMLSNTGPVNLQDLSAIPVTYLTVQANGPDGWPPLFGYQVDATAPYFTLQLSWNPPSGGVGVTLPVVAEQFLNLSPATAAAEIDNESSLILVDSFAQMPAATLSAYDLMNVDPSTAMPSITLSGTSGVSTALWIPLKDLLESGATDPVFVAEVEYTNVATLRFGDNTNGKMPDSGTVFDATYRIGNGSAGNVGANSITFVASLDAPIQNAVCTNPLPAAGGTDPETDDQIRRRAPVAFLTQERAITMADYESFADVNAQVDQSVASMRWTGSWYTVFIAVEPKGGGTLSTGLQKQVRQYVNEFRLAGQDLQLDSPQYVSLQIGLTICIDPSYFQADVQQALLAVLGNQVLPNGQTGFFFADNFTFGKSVYLSPIYAAVLAVPGVTGVTANTFQPQGTNTEQYLDTGELPLGPLQIARLENNPSFPDHGQLTLTLQGGK
ncbi:MAG TPA: putative baseplate assembly protein [Acidobacteriaceae bacterium]|nr:putative baseplate assembly protein [Acidobacteriaceae bacterium]